MYNFDAVPHIGPGQRIQLPDPSEADGEGIIGFGGNLSPGMLLSAYEQGFFPWFSPGDPIIWWSPDPRFVLPLKQFHLSRRTLRDLAKRQWLIEADGDFNGVITACAQISRKGETGTWISDDMIRAYLELHRLGFAHSVEIRDQDDRLIGGLYGVCRGSMFCGESMFSAVTGASKLAIAALVRFLVLRKASPIIDSQISNPHMKSLGGINIPRRDYLAALREAQSGAEIRDWNAMRTASTSVVEFYRNNMQ
jgi:leucyl/phenylalanyl-tRNA--protein transferase